MIDVDLIRRKLSRLNMYLEKLEPISNRKFEEYVSDSYLKYTAERLIQLIIECASDVNNHVVVKMKKRPPEDYSISFVRAAEIGLISADLAERIKRSGGMRNILVHEYADIDDDKVYNVIPIAIKDYREYIRQVDCFIDKLE